MKRLAPIAAVLLSITVSLSAAVLLSTGCGVGRLHSARPRGRIELRLVALAEPQIQIRRWFSDEVLNVETTVILNSEQIAEVQLEELPDGTEHIVLRLDDEGRERLATASVAARGHRLAVIVDDRIVMAPTIRSAITNGVAHITTGDAEQTRAVYQAMIRPNPMP